MLTMFKQIFTWWNSQTLGTRISTFFHGKLIGEDEFGIIAIVMFASQVFNLVITFVYIKSIVGLMNQVGS